MKIGDATRLCLRVRISVAVNIDDSFMAFYLGTFINHVDFWHNRQLRRSKCVFLTLANYICALAVVARRAHRFNPKRRYVGSWLEAEEPLPAGQTNNKGEKKSYYAA